VHPKRRTGTVLHDVYRRLRRHRGPAGWWPGETPFEICLGAILVQNTAWTNVAKALDTLRSRRMLSYAALEGLTAAEIAPLIRSAGCFNVKARRVRAFLDFLGATYGGRVEAMRNVDPQTLRAQLLAVSGIGRETADSIALYAAERPLFVIDAYTRRVFSRLGLVTGDEPYDELQRRFMRDVPPKVALYNDFHAQIVLLAQETCRPRPLCPACPLEAMCARMEVQGASRFRREQRPRAMQAERTAGS
jgi:endonuclease III related protein